SSLRRPPPPSPLFPYTTLFRSALQRLREVPGASAAGGVDYAPLSGVANDQNFELEGKPVPPGTQAPDEEIRIVTPGWFEAMDIPDRKSTRLNSSHLGISYAVFC